MATSGLLSAFSLSFIRKRSASEARYMSLRTLPTEVAGILAIEPYWSTRFAMSFTSAASDTKVPSLILRCETKSVTAGRGSPSTL